MEALIYWDSRNRTLIAVTENSWLNSGCELLGTLKFDKMSEPTTDSISEFALSRMSLLGILIPHHSGRLPVRNYAKHAYWGRYE